jgi:hypothetical protein
MVEVRGQEKNELQVYDPECAVLALAEKEKTITTKIRKRCPEANSEHVMVRAKTIRVLWQLIDVKVGQGRERSVIVFEGSVDEPVTNLE